MIRDPSLEAKYFCSSTKSTCELTNETPGTASTVSFSFIRKAIFVSMGTSNGSRVNALVHVVTTLSAPASVTLREAIAAFAFAIATARSATAVADAGVHAVAGGEAPRAVHQHAQAEAAARRSRDALHLPLARGDRLAAVAVDADVGVARAERGGARERGLRDVHTERVVGRARLEDVRPRRHGGRRDGRGGGREELTAGLHGRIIAGSGFRGSDEPRTQNPEPWNPEPSLSRRREEERETGDEEAARMSGASHALK